MIVVSDGSSHSQSTGDMKAQFKKATVTARRFMKIQCITAVHLRFELSPDSKPQGHVSHEEETPHECEKDTSVLANTSFTVKAQ